MHSSPKTYDAYNYSLLLPFADAKIEQQRDIVKYLAKKSVTFGIISTFIILRNGNYEKKMWLFNTKVEQPHSFDGSMLVDDLEQLYEEFPELIDSLDLETLGWRVYATQSWAE